MQTQKTFLTQFKAVYWKNFVLGYRSKELLAEIIFPLITSALMMIKNILPSISFLAPIIVALAINGSTRSLLIRLVEEKSGRHKETQKIMGLSQTAYFFAWYASALTRTFIGAFLFLTLPMLFATSPDDVIYVTNPFTDSIVHPNIADIRKYIGFWDVYFNYDATGFVVLYIFYVLSSINQAFMISSCFSNPKLAGEIGTFFTTITTLLSFLVYYQKFIDNPFWFYLISIFPQANMAFGYIASVKTPIYYNAGVDITPSFNQSDAIYEMIGTTVIYIVLYFYLEQVIPNEYGIAKHPLLCLKKKKPEINSLRGSRISLGDNNQNKTINDNLNEKLLINNVESTDIEGTQLPLQILEDTSSAYYHEPYEKINKLKRTVEISKLTKKFGGLKAVNDVSISLYEKNIFCLLGHNGAGKTTMISVLTGLIQKSRGDVKMYGKDLEDDLEVIRQNLGICSQRDVVYDEMTFIEHLEYYATIKGVKPENIKKEIESILKKTKCMGEKDKLAMALSGGNRRKLSLGMALIGGSQIVFLDEPTSGMDAISRRAIWEILELVRNEERTIVLTTHHLDEAEVLADRIAIMAKGKLLAVGTSDFIKKNFGVGYHLRVFPNSNYEKASEFTITEEIREQVKQIIFENIPGSAFNPQSRKDMLIFLVPFDQASTFGKVFDQIEKIDGLQINLEMNSLEDAFVNIGMEEEKFLENKEFRDKQIAEGVKPKQEPTEEKYTKFDEIPKPQCLQNPPVYRFSTQFLACFLRKFYCTIRAFSNYLAFFIPLALLIAGATILEVTDNNLQETEKLQVFSLFIALAYSFNGGIYIMLPVQEREENLKYALNVMGCRVHTYWLATFLFDIIAYFLTTTIFMIVSVASGYSFVTLKPFQLLIALLAFGFSFITFSYMCGFMFKKANSALKGFPALNFFVVFNVPYAFQGIFALLYQEQYISKGVWEAFGIFFNIINIFLSPFYNIQCCVQYLPPFEMADQPPFYYISYDYWAYFGILIFQGFFYAFVTYMLEQKKYNKIGKVEEDEVKSQILEQEHINEIEDEAVLQEQQRIKDLQQNIDLNGSTIGEATEKIIAQKLWKQYDNGFVAIKDVSYGVKKGEIFGLLGPNGSGKSTSFNILTSLIPKTIGSVKIKNIEVNKGIMKIYQDVGICPQFDCIWPNLNPVEHLYLFGRMKGLQGQDLKEAVEYFIQIMQLTAFIKTKAKNLSGGNKRKLCVSDALIGGPDIQFFDEPSTGVDPIARRFLWNTLQEGSKIRNSAIVLTTHTMEEAESLCTKIGILINGQFYCLGSPSELRHKYGEGYTIVIKGIDEQVQKFQDEIYRVFPNCRVLKDKKDGYYNYRISNQEFSFSKSYKLCQELKDQQVIQDYSINQSSLEQVFVYFSKYQNANQK